jgi:pimeloyl-ACP methyl ester carboxylesterase
VALFLIMAALLSLLFLCFAVAYWLANLLLYPRRQPLLHTPADYGMAYEEVTFRSKDRLRIKGWWIPAAGPAVSPLSIPVVIILHPFLGNRHGLVRKARGQPRHFHTDLDLLQTALLFHRAGYAALMFDFRSHGESQRGLCAGGLTEDQDVMGAVDYVFDRVIAEEALVRGAPEKGNTAKPSVGIVGYGLGASAAFAAIGREKGGAETIRVFNGDSEGGSSFVEIPPLTVKYLRFVIAVQPHSPQLWLSHYLRKCATLLAWWLIPVVDHICQRRGGFPLTVKRLLNFARGVNVPVLYAQSSSSPRDDSREAQMIYNALPGQKEMWWLEGTCEPCGAYRYVTEHPGAMLAFSAGQVG